MPYSMHSRQRQERQSPAPCPGLHSAAKTSLWGTGQMAVSELFVGHTMTKDLVEALLIKGLMLGDAKDRVDD